MMVSELANEPSRLHPMRERRAPPKPWGSALGCPDRPEPPATSIGSIREIPAIRRPPNPQSAAPLTRILPRL